MLNGPRKVLKVDDELILRGFTEGEEGRMALQIGGGMTNERVL